MSVVLPCIFTNLHREIDIFKSRQLILLMCLMLLALFVHVGSVEPLQHLPRHVQVLAALPTMMQPAPRVNDAVQHHVARPVCLKACTVLQVEAVLVALTLLKRALPVVSTTGTSLRKTVWTALSIWL